MGPCCWGQSCATSGGHKCHLFLGWGCCGSCWAMEVAAGTARSPGAPPASGTAAGSADPVTSPGSSALIPPFDRQGFAGARLFQLKLEGEFWARSALIVAGSSPCSSSSPGMAPEPLPWSLNPCWMRVLSAPPGLLGSGPRSPNHCVPDGSGSEGRKGQSAARPHGKEPQEKPREEQ